MEQTFSIIKPNAMKKNAIGAIIKKFEDNGLKIAAAKIIQMEKSKAEEFYAEHKERPFFGELVELISWSNLDRQFEAFNLGEQSICEKTITVFIEKDK